jgi:hypothetical protein
MAELTDMTVDQLDAYQAEIWRLSFELTDAAREGRFRDAGDVFRRLLEAQAAYGMLPARPEYDAILDELDKVPSRVLGIRQ